jgi:cellulose synthase/poly-beta-1,6-N-acetylglucosamine synthase-like glycosyltransferase
VQFVISLFGGLLAVGWGGIAADYARGARRSRRLEDQPPATADEAPPLSVVLAACNEEEKLPVAFRTLLAQDYPGPMEIVAVDDRSTDSTPALLDALALEAPEGKTVIALHLTQLPAGWLGKNHALWQGAQHATGKWILFTDADIHFAPDALSRSIGYAQREDLDHLVSFFGLDLQGFWENIFGLCFSFLFFMRFRPWRVRDHRTKNYLGVGGFNLVRRDAYEAIGTHRALALEVADDMELGRRLKHAGFHCDVVGAEGMIRVRWQEGGLFGLMNGLSKNAYAGLNYSPATLLASVALLLWAMVWPLIGLFAARTRWGRAGYALSLAFICSMGAYHARKGGIPPLYGLTLPLSTLLLITVMFRSAYITEKNGGITWRNTFYPLDELRRREMPPVPPVVGAG